MARGEGSPREVYAVTNRPYEMYLRFLKLPENYLAGKRILDVGAGLSDFAETVNNKFKDTGSLAVALDLNYSIIGKEDFDSKLWENRGHFENHSGKEGMTLEEIYEHRKDRIAAIKEQAKQQGTVVAADRERLPFADDSFDLVIYNNSLYPSLGSKRYNPLLQSAIFEAGRVVKETGQIRIVPNMFDHDESGKIMLINAGPIMKPADNANPEIIEFFRNCSEILKYNFYLIEDQWNEDEDKRWVAHNLVITKSPHKFSAEEVRCESDEQVRVQSLSFKDVRDNMTLASTVVYRSE